VNPFAAPLLRWYRRERRDLPWRRTCDPYAIWIAETMLQQTRTQTVLRYYPRFLARFPTVRSLAAAREDTVLAYWSGLGYYGRARNLRRAARDVVARHGGCLPRDPEALRALAGIGRYTAGAVASIAFGVPAAVLDGNVARVLSRWFAVRGPVRSAPVTRLLWRRAQSLVDRRAPGEWNQALMELGATVCTARSPGCDRCPVRRSCAAHRGGRVHRFPQAAGRAPARRLRRASVVLESAGRVLMMRRDADGLLGGLWEFPSAELRAREDPANGARSALRRVGARVLSIAAHGSFLQSITDWRIRTFVFSARSHPSAPPIRIGRWLRRREVARLPLSAASLRILRMPTQPARKIDRPRRANTSASNPVSSMAHVPGSGTTWLSPLPTRLPA
jgi:A/G-specific adenine glycosylase